VPSCTRLKLLIGWALLPRAVTQIGVHTGNKQATKGNCPFLVYIRFIERRLRWDTGSLSTHASSRRNRPLNQQSHECYRTNAQPCVYTARAHANEAACSQSSPTAPIEEVCLVRACLAYDTSGRTDYHVRRPFFEIKQPSRSLISTPMYSVLLSLGTHAPPICM
jgi:hypothetical protein